MDKDGLIDELGEIIYVSDLETYDLLFANAYCKSMMKSPDYQGHKCYEMLQDRNEPCEFCTNPLLTYDAFYVWEYTNPMMGQRHFLLKDKLIHWKGKPARLEIAVDITEQENVSQQVQQKLKTERTLVACIRALTEAQSLDEAIQAVLSNIGEFYQAERAYILEMNDTLTVGSNTYEWCAPGVSPQIHYLQEVELAMIPFWQQAIQKQSLITIQDVEALRDDFPTEYGRMQQQGIHGLIAAPFLLGEKSLGYIGVDNPSYHAEDPSLLQSLSYFVINEMKQRRLQEELEYQNSHDVLTGLYNRLQYHKYLSTIHTQALASLGVVFCDINGLKQINDTQGHGYGDQVIVRTADILQRSFVSHKVYRLSGDEFVVFCENVSQDIFQQMVEKAQHKFAGEQNNGISMGVVWSDKEIDLPLFIRQADEQMYHKKQCYYQQHPRQKL